MFPSFSLFTLSATFAALTIASPVLGSSSGAEGDPSVKSSTSAPKLVFPGSHWQKSDPETAKVYEAKLAEAKELYDSLGGTSAMIVKDGVSIAEWGDVSRESNVHSIRKSILSGLIGIAVERKQMDLSKTLSELGIDDNEPALTDVEKGATLHDLLKARSGVYHPALYESEGMKKRRPARGSHLPGTFWYYNNWDFNALGTIYEHAVGESMFSAFEREIARPLKMEDYSATDGHYVYGEDSNHRAYPFSMSSRDLARFALLYLNGGKWEDQQIIPKEWVKQSGHPFSETPDGGYGYMWWTSDRPDAASETLPGAYFAAGAGGQSAYVIPSHGLVVVHRVDTRITEKRVSGKQIAELVTKIVKALED